MKNAMFIILMLAIVLACGAPATSQPTTTPTSFPTVTQTDIPLPTDTPTSVPPTTTPIPQAPTKSKTDKLYDALIDELGKDIIGSVRFSGRDLIIQTKLTRTDLQGFYAEIGAIHGVVIRENPDVERVILDDSTGQQIIMPMDRMKDFYEGSIDWDTFRSTWTVINP